MNADLPTNLKKARKSRGLTQKSLANLSGLSVTTISNLESGKRPPSFNSLVLLAAAMKCSADEIIYGSSDQQNVLGLRDDNVNALVSIATLIASGMLYIHGEKEIDGIHWDEEANLELSPFVDKQAVLDFSEAVNNLQRLRSTVASVNRDFDKMISELIKETLNKMGKTLLTKKGKMK